MWTNGYYYPRRRAVTMLLAVLLLQSPTFTNAFTVPTSSYSSSLVLSSSRVTPSSLGFRHQPPPPPRTPTSLLIMMMNIPIPTKEGGATPEEIQDAANSTPPPSSFYELQRASIRATQCAIDAGHTLLEIEYPPLPANVLEMDDVSAYDVARANVKLALEYARAIVNVVSTTTTTTTYTSSQSSTAKQHNKEVAVLLPDESELQIMYEDLQLNAHPYPGVQLTSLRRGSSIIDDNGKEDYRLFKPENIFIGLLGRGSGGTVKPLPNTFMYIIVVASAQELPDVEELYEQIKHERDESTGQPSVIVFYNLKLDILRGDLGAPAFPSKALHDRFLSRIKPVYYLRTRQYSRSVSTPPFVLNYQGCLFRAYPGHYQTLLDTGSGRYRKVVGNDIRPPLGTFKEQLTDALRDEGAIVKKEKEGVLFGFLRTGYKTTTWWEDEREEASMDWRT